MMLRWVLATALCVGGSRVAAAQTGGDFPGTDRETAVQLTQIVESLRSRGLPTEPVFAKASRAAQLHAPSARLLSAVQAVATRLEQAREALGAASPKADIAAGEDALAIAGVTPEMLRLMRAAQPTRSVAVALGVMAQLVASGVKPAHASEVVSRLVRGNATSAQLVALGNEVIQDVSAGAAALASLQTRLETLKPVLARVPPGSAAAAIAAHADPRGRP